MPCVGRPCWEVVLSLVGQRGRAIQNLDVIAKSSRSEFLNVAFRSFSWSRHAPLIPEPHTLAFKFTEGDDPMKVWLKPEITESEAGMEVTSYLPAELDSA